MNSIPAFAASAALVFAAAVPALAEPSAVNIAAPGAREVSVSFADLDTTKRAGAQTLIRRIRMAAQAVCGPAPAPLALGETRAFNRCVRTSMDKAVREVAAPQVSALYLNDRG